MSDQLMPDGPDQEQPKPKAKRAPRVKPVATPEASEVVKSQFSDEVHGVQQLLIKHGYSVGADGESGPQTALAIRSFQAMAGLSVGSEVTPEVAAALSGPVAVRLRMPTLQEGNEGAPVKTLQKLLNALLLEDLEVTSVFDAATTEAVKKFQEMAGLKPDGLVAVETWLWLGRK